LTQQITNLVNHSEEKVRKICTQHSSNPDDITELCKLFYHKRAFRSDVLYKNVGPQEFLTFLVDKSSDLAPVTETLHVLTQTGESKKQFLLFIHYAADEIYRYGELPGDFNRPGYATYALHLEKTLGQSTMNIENY